MSTSETYEDVKKILTECGMTPTEYPNQKWSAGGWPHWVCTNWKELGEATGRCSTPEIGSLCWGATPFWSSSVTHRIRMFLRKLGLKIPVPTTLLSVEVYDDFVWNNKKYRWPATNEEQPWYCPTCEKYWR